MFTNKCMKVHSPHPICMAERSIAFHNTQFRIVITVHEYYCDKCKKARRTWEINKGYYCKRCRGK